MVLILGSFDKETKPALLALKSVLARGLMSEEWAALVVLLDDVEIYKLDVPDSAVSRFVISEAVDSGLSLFLISDRKFEDAVDIGTPGEETDAVVARFVRERFDGTVLKLGILDKVGVLAQIMEVAYLVRHVELTRGGEYIELAFLIGLERTSHGKIWFMKREGFDLSQMAWEILDKFGVHMRSYRDTDGLCAEALRIARYQSVGHGGSPP